ncbi:LysR family transcriptional regulator [Devosia sp. RR2S18]|jgi:DNA-binding transcriptional LysR family regulator|uniref:LysR family transcriptional regulator n=1 Tax=Devosia rhizosphaerae TaxID=3049774 RepID=UPI00254106ED|nr:LysR family transcriptional regulator [Devosia sp. RR2S18]WIJ26308.1 LysR family transcriptional regulator [Devosia sp. RR2S18]HEV7291593.1 LysR family transcriptional regulator [Devosia sp.]
MLDWDKLRIFHTAAESGSFTHAAEKLGMSQSAVSRQISALEDDLGLKLFIRHARGLVLTEVGEQLFRTAHRMHWELQQVETQMSESQDVPTGPLIVTTTVGIGSTWLSARLDEFLKLYPLIQLEIRLNDAELDLAMREADVAIRLHRPNQSEMIQRKLFTVHNHFYASKSYVEEHGTPTSVDQLDDHRVISFGEPVPSYLGDINFLERLGRSDSSPRRAVLKVNAIYGMLQACQAGIGIAMLPDYVTEQTESLVQILPEIELPAYEAFFVYPPALKSSKRVGVFRDYLVTKAREWSF